MSGWYISRDYPQHYKIDKEDSVVIAGIICYKTTTEDPDGKIDLCWMSNPNERPYAHYTPGANHHIISVRWRYGFEITGTGITLDEAQKEFQKCFKMTLDDINLIKNRIL